jgi:hypothetical protein
MANDQIPMNFIDPMIMVDFDNAESRPFGDLTCRTANRKIAECAETKRNFPFRYSVSRFARAMKPANSRLSELRQFVAASLCAGHAQQFGGESPLPNLMEVKG